MSGDWNSAFRIWICLCLCSGCTQSAPDQSTLDQSKSGQSISDHAGDRSTGQPEDKTRELAFDLQLENVIAGSTREIRLTSAKLSSEEFSRIAGLEQLQVLVVDAGKLEDGDVDVLITLMGLEHLRLRDCPLTDVGFSQIGRSQLNRLAIFNAPQAKPTSKGLSELGKLPMLRQLRIGGRQIDDAAISELTRWPSLSSLHLIGPRITDTSLRTIASMPKLTSFYLDDCPLSDSAWEELFRTRPNLHVHVDQAHHDRDPGSH